jgi:hypothetical protein
MARLGVPVGLDDHLDGPLDALLAAMLGRAAEARPCGVRAHGRRLEQAVRRSGSART